MTPVPTPRIESISFAVAFVKPQDMHSHSPDCRGVCNPVVPLATVQQIIAAGVDIERELTQAAEKRDEYKILWERDSTSLGKMIGERDHHRTIAEDRRALLAQRDDRIRVLTEALEVLVHSTTMVAPKHCTPYANAEVRGSALINAHAALSDIGARDL